MKANFILPGLALGAAFVLTAQAQDQNRPDDDERHGHRGERGARLAALDTDDDERISAAEFLASERAVENPDQAAEAFARMDVDGNGFIEQADRDAARQKRMGERFDSIDSNGDGSISREEFLAQENRREGRRGGGRRWGRDDD